MSTWFHRFEFLVPFTLPVQSIRTELETGNKRHITEPNASESKSLGKKQGTSLEQAYSL